MNDKQLAGGPRLRRLPAPDGYRYAVRVWDQDQPAARVLFVHGIVSHGGWYLRTGRVLAANHLEPHFLERRGSGLNLAGRGDVTSHDVWLRDAESYLESLPADRPRIVLGVSWGGKLAAALARRRPELVSALGLVCPGLFARQFPGRLKYALLAGARACGLGGVRVPIPLDDPALFTDSPRWQEYLRHDPLMLRRVSVRFALEDRRLTRYAREAPEKIAAPTLLMLARRDRIVDNRLTEDFFRRLPTDQKRLIIYPEAGHTLEFEPVGHPYWDDLLGWLREVSQASGTG